MLGDNIIAQRKRLGLSQQALADQLHVVRQTVSKWEKNLSVPDADALVRLADALDTSVQALLGAGDASDAPAAPELAATLARINEQLVIQNRRRHRIWTAVAWILGLLIALNVLLIVLGWSATAAFESLTVQESGVIEMSAPGEAQE